MLPKTAWLCGNRGLRILRDGVGVATTASTYVGADGRSLGWVAARTGDALGSSQESSTHSGRVDDSRRDHAAQSSASEHGALGTRAERNEAVWPGPRTRAHSPRRSYARRPRLGVGPAVVPARLRAGAWLSIAPRSSGVDVLRFNCLRYRVVVVVTELSRTCHVIERLCSVRLGLLLPR